MMRSGNGGADDTRQRRKSGILPAGAEASSHPNRRDVMLAAPAAAVVATASVPPLAQAQVPAAAPAVPPATPAPTQHPASAALATRAVEASRATILRISREVWANPELSLREEKSSAIHVRELEAAGFRVTKGVANIPTCFVAQWSQGSGGAKVGFLPEYDALPGLGNAAEPRQVAGPTGAEVGHGCGHNVLGAGCTGAGLALKRMMEETGTPGTVRVYGCAAEEGGGGKVFMTRDGLFDDLDAALAWHPAPIAGTGAVSMAANNAMKVRFFGRTAHAGNSPWDGRSALKAAELFAHGVNLMREHVLPTTRLHYIYENAGVAPNVVPDFAQLWMTVRDRDRAHVGALTDWVKQIAQGAAMATQTRAEVDVYLGLHPLLPNDALIALAHRHLSATPLDWTPEEQAFARNVQKAMGLPETGMATRVLPILGEINAGGSTDVGDISFVTPTGLFAWPTLPLGISLHTWGVTACGGMSIGDRAALATARILAGMGHDVLTDPALRDAARADLRRRKGDYVYVSPLPPDRIRPEGIPPHLLKTGEDEIVSPLRMLGG
jgi:aminobenzoyl-glutamate utilization protein B